MCILVYIDFDRFLFVTCSCCLRVYMYIVCWLLVLAFCITLGVLYVMIHFKQLRLTDDTFPSSPLLIHAWWVPSCQLRVFFSFQELSFPVQIPGLQKLVFVSKSTPLGQVSKQHITPQHTTPVLATPVAACSLGYLTSIK